MRGVHVRHKRQFRGNRGNFLELDPAKGDTWTLFIPFKKEKSWGFFTKNGFVNNEEYLENKKNN